MRTILFTVLFPFLISWPDDKLGVRLQLHSRSSDDRFQEGSIGVLGINVEVVASEKVS